MRLFDDRAGERWDVVVGRESWGALYALFLPRGRAGSVRQSLLRSAAYLDAQQQLEQMSDAELQEMLDRSEPKEG